MEPLARGGDWARYKGLIASMPYGYYRSTDVGRFVEVNAAFARMLGYTEEELLEIDIPALLYFDPSEREMGERNLSFLPATETYRLRRKDGSEVWVEDFARYDRDNDTGRVRFHEGICRDITERREAEESQKRLNSRLLILTDIASALLGARLDPTEVLELAVRRCTDLIGDGAAIFLHSSAKPFLELVSVHNVDPRAARTFRDHFAQNPLPSNVGPHGAVMEENTPLLFDSEEMERVRSQVESPLREYYRLLPVFSAVYAPLRFEGKCIGVLGIEKHHPDHPAFVQDDIRFFQDVADQTSIALSNARLHRTLERELAERRETEARLRESEERYRTLVDMSPDGIVVQAEDRIAYLNNAAVSLIGGTAAGKIFGLRITDLLKIESGAEAGTDRLEHLSAVGKGSLGECTLLRLDGTKLAVEAEGAVVSYLGKPAFQIVFRDITERREAESRLRLQSTALDTAANGIIITDRSGTIVWANPAFARLTGYSVADAIGKDPRTLVRSNQHDPAFYREMAEVIERGDVWRGEVVNRRKDGTFYTEEMTVTPVKDEHGRVTHYVQIKQDVSERKRAEEQLRASNAEKEILLKEIHHRVKNNLQVISSLLSLQAKRAQDPAAREVFEESRHRIHAMAAVHQELYRSDNLARVRFDEYLVSVANELFRSYGSERIARRFDVESVQIDVDTAIPCGLIANELITNALKHGFPGDRRGTITVGLRREGGDVLLSVRDDGIGFPAEQDYRTVSSMGMTLVLSLAAQVRGDVSLDGSAGTCFLVRIPVE